MFDLYKKFSTKHVNPQKNMSQQTAEIQHLMQSMADLADITPDLLEALGILRFLNSDSSYSQLVQQIKSMKLKEFTAASITHLVNGVERPKTTVAAVAGVKRKANFSNGQFAKKTMFVWNLRNLATMNQTVGSNTPKNALRIILRMIAEMYQCKLMSPMQQKNLKGIKVNRKATKVMID